MTIQDVITKVTTLRSERKCTSDFILDKINEIEWRIKREIIDVHEGCEKHPFDGYDSTETEVKLIAPAPYSELYIKWVLYQVDVNNNDMVNAANSLALFKEAYDAYSAWYTRNNMPVYRGNLKSEGYNV